MATSLFWLMCIFLAQVITGIVLSRFIQDFNVARVYLYLKRKEFYWETIMF